MAVTAQTLSIKLGARSFQRVTLGMMLHANSTLKHHGFGQCVVSWLQLWREDALDLGGALAAAEAYEADFSRTAKIWLALNPQDLITLRECRSTIEQMGHCPITLACVAYILADSVCARNENIT
jgi:hypothetical protein